MTTSAPSLVALLSAGLNETAGAIVIDEEVLRQAQAAAGLVPADRRRDAAVDVLALAVKINRVTDGTGVDARPALQAIVGLIDALVDEATALDVFVSAGFAAEAANLLGRNRSMRAPTSRSTPLAVPVARPRRGLAK